MAYTVEHFYKKVLEQTDKMGSDFFPKSYVRNRLMTATYDFIGETVKFVENTQEIRDDLLALYKPFKLPIITDPADSDYLIASLPSDYLHLMSVSVKDENVTVRETNLIRHGQEEILLIDPDTKPTAEYPIVSAYETYLRIYSPGSPTSVFGFYIAKPTFGDFNLATDIAVNLPDNSTEKIIKIIVNDIFVATGDPRAQIQYANTESFRQRSR